MLFAKLTPTITPLSASPEVTNIPYAKLLTTKEKKIKTHKINFIFCFFVILLGLSFLF
jgi:hypothetical protein